MTLYPIKRTDGKHDKRYTIDREYCGQYKPLYVLRFCGDFISSHKNPLDAIQAAKLHKLGY